ncbi:unnamed protein product [Mycena citricolor]|uniref:Uncharacterized protein n=1 Tax=Mycena citricolor TaxID=2018698 RepID=A0AAD2JU14_9AGAR|nr:unnamed protein product [Mycena citricolor]
MGPTECCLTVCAPCQFLRGLFPPIISENPEPSCIVSDYLRTKCIKKLGHPQRGQERGAQF